MRIAVRWTAVVLMTLGVCVCTHAQYQDRDSSGVPKTSSNAPPPEERVDINHASIAELRKVPGMTDSWAGRIVRYRPYYSKVDLLQRGIISDAVYDRIKDYIIAHRSKE